MKIVYTFLAFTLLAVSPGCQKNHAVPKHVFFIVIDTLRADHLGCYGYNVTTSPTIDQLAKEGVIFNNACSTASNTLESVISFFTSTIVLSNTVFTQNLPSGHTSIQTCFKQAGYNTLAVVSNPWLKTRPHLFMDGFNHHQYAGTYWQSNATEIVTQHVLDFLENKFDSPGKNFFYIHYLDPHGPYSPPRDYGFFSGEKPDRSFDLYTLSGEDAVVRNYREDPAFAGIARPEALSSNDVAYLTSSYDGEIRYVDTHIKKLLDRLQKMDILKDSLIVITSDHGEEFLEHGCLKHGFQLYNETIHIPLIFYWPGRLTPERKQAIVSGIDLAPTILELCRIKPPPRMLGKNILAKTPYDEPILFCTHFINQKQWGIRSKEWKFIKNLKTEEIRISDLGNDPEERNNLFDNDRKKWDHLFKAFEKLVLKYTASQNGPGGDRSKIDEETRKQLEALGYLH